MKRFGYRKTYATDVARTLGVNHGSIYRHFQTKQILFAAVTCQAISNRVVLRAAGSDLTSGMFSSARSTA